jgi:hypothetical protein
MAKQTKQVFPNVIYVTKENEKYNPYFLTNETELEAVNGSDTPYSYVVTVAEYKLVNVKKFKQTVEEV